MNWSKLVLSEHRDLLSARSDDLMMSEAMSDLHQNLSISDIDVVVVECLNDCFSGNIKPFDPDILDDSVASSVYVFDVFVDGMFVLKEAWVNEPSVEERSTLRHR